MIAILDNIRSVHNVGSIFRTADGAGVRKIYLCGITPKPLDEFGRVRDDFRKVSLGAEESVEWEKVESIVELVKKLKDEGVQVVAVEQDDRSVSYKDWKPDGEVAFVFGSEVGGVSRGVLDMVDVVVDIPMRGKKESVDVGVSFGGIVYEFQSITPPCRRRLL